MFYQPTTTLKITMRGMLSDNNFATVINMKTCMNLHFQDEMEVICRS